jgi:hypothetical protein
MTGAIIPDAQPLRLGDPVRLGAYEILGRLGEGGQGAVFLAHRGGDPEFLAIKLLHTGQAGDAAARARFVRELEVAKLVARFCTAQVLDADVAGDRPYIVSEYVSGRSLHSLVQAEGPRSGGALERLAISTLTALTAIHQAGIVHRDFKPQNVMLGPDGPRVIDFGVARALGAAGTTQNVGTPSYMAPENFSGKPIGPATDLFAWGTTMVFAATGRPAFGNDEIGAVMHRIIHAEPDLGGLPSPLREVVAACLAKEPAHRPTAKEAQERLLGAVPDAPPPTPAPYGPVEMQHGPTTGKPRTVEPYGPVLVQHGPVPQTTAPHGPVAEQGTTVDGLRGGRRVPLMPVIAGAIVVALLLTGTLVWAAVLRDSSEPTGPATSMSAERSAQGSDGAAGSMVTGSGGQKGRTTTKPAGAATLPSGRSTSLKERPTTGAGNRPGGGSTGTTGTGTTGSGGGTGGSANPYTPEQVCNSGGHGSGYYRQRSSTFSGGKVHQLYNSSGYNCLVTMKTANIGKKTNVWATLTRKDGTSATDNGAYMYYAGPVYLYAKGQCVKYQGGTGQTSAAAPWGNCG